MKKQIQFEMSELQYELVKAALRSAQVATRREYEKATEGTTMSGGLEERNKAATMRVLSAEYDKNSDLQQMMTDQFWAHKDGTNQN